MVDRYGSGTGRLRGPYLIDPVSADAPVTSSVMLGNRVGHVGRENGAVKYIGTTVVYTGHAIIFLHELGA